jgi:hypothetical protein
MKLAALAFLTILTLGASASLNAQTTSAQTSDPIHSSLTGNWRITWLKGGTPNKIKLTDSDGAITGTFAEDVGESCPVTGSYASGTITLQVTCAKFTVQMKGQLKDLEVTGNYVAYGNATGEFKMEKLACWLPEGCGQ